MKRTKRKRKKKAIVEKIYLNLWNCCVGRARGSNIYIYVQYFFCMRQFESWNSSETISLTKYIKLYIQMTKTKKIQSKRIQLSRKKEKYNLNYKLFLKIKKGKWNLKRISERQKEKGAAIGSKHEKKLCWTLTLLHKIQITMW